MNNRIAEMCKSTWGDVSSIPEDIRSKEKSRKLSGVLSIIGLAAVTCAGVSIGVKIVQGIDNYAKVQEEMNRAGLAEPSCTGEVVNKQHTPEHEIIIPAGQTYTTIEVPESQTVTMTLGAGCRPGTPGREVKVGVRDDLWNKVQPGDMLYHPGGSTGWDIYDNYPVSMDDSTGSKENDPMNNNGDDVIVRDLPASKDNESIEPAASEFHISPQALEETASN
jgi:hypothetical protein